MLSVINFLRFGCAVVNQESSRPTPEELLARVNEKTSGKGLGRLKIFLGAAAGVGKTYTMLETAQRLLKDGIDVVAGVVVTHGRKETEALRAGLEEIPLQSHEYKNTALEEFNLDSALSRKPEVLLIDELAHTNAPGSRHEKRWQDVDELLGAGIDVLTTLNIQHLESVNDMVAQITGIKVRETVPDYIFEKAYEIELVDLPPDDLIQRLQEGKIYMPDATQSALENFFRKPNLIALREIALRLTAERVDAQMQQYRPVEQVWPATDRLMVCIGPSPLSIRLVRATKRMAASMRAEWLAVFVETPSTVHASEASRRRISRTLRTAEKLGAEIVTLSGIHPSEEIFRYARKRNVTKIVIGKPARPRWREILFGSVVDELIRLSGNIDVYVITGDTVTEQPHHIADSRTQVDVVSYLCAIGIVVIATVLVKLVSQHLTLVNLVMIYQLGVVITALKFGKGPSILSALLSVAIFDFFFVPPYLSFVVSDTQYLITFAVMLTVGLTLSTMTSELKKQAELFRNRELQTAALYRLTREQSIASSTQQVIEASVRHIGTVFNSDVCVLILTDAEQLELVEHPHRAFLPDSKEQAVAQWALLNKQQAGLGTDTLSGASARYIPLIAGAHALGVVGIKPADPIRLDNPDEVHFLETFVNQMALSLTRAEQSHRSADGKTEDQEEAQLSGDVLRSKSSESLDVNDRSA